MKRAMFFLVAVCLVAAAGAAVLSKDVPVPRPRFYRPSPEYDLSGIPGNDPRASVIAAVDTYCIVNYDFEQMDWQGWTRIDNMAQAGTFFHVDDFAGLGGGTRGMLVPLEGTKSMWCGVRPGTDPYLCSWETAPGYGNHWDQSLQSDVMSHTGIVTLSYKYSFDTELGNDYMSVIFAPAYQETEVARYSGRESGVATHELFSASASFYLKFRFVSDRSDSDQDGLRDYDGAFIVDSITVSDESGLIDYEDFESAAVGATETGIWWAYPEDGYGVNSCLANNLMDRDPCNDNFASQIVFICHQYPVPPPGPGLYTTPFCTGSGAINDPCQDEMVFSPWIDLRWYSSNCREYQDTGIPPGELGDLGGCMLTYSVYLDNPAENLVFHTWKVRNMNDGCPGPWLSDPLVRYYGEGGLYYWFEHDISDYVTSDLIQVAVGVVDMCSVWYGIYGDCAEHTPAPWFDNVKVSRYSVVGPQWSYQGADLFQDNFPSTDDIESYVRADMAADISPPSYPDIVPGDSVVVTCWAPNAGGLDTLGTGEVRVYMHCNVYFLGLDGKPDLFGPQLEGNYGSYVSDDGDWTVLLCEPGWTSAGTVAPDKYCVDLNDSLFTRGYMIEYYFKAYDLDGISTTLPERAENIPPSSWPPPPCCPERPIFEFTCLPGLRSVPDILYVDDFDGRGTPEGLVQTYLDPVFDAFYPYSGPPDRYDVNQPSSVVGNGLGSRAKQSHLKIAYEAILWDSGDLSEGTLVSGLDEIDKSDDIGTLIEWLNDHDRTGCSTPGGLIILGDNVASDLSTHADGLVLLNDWCGAELVHDSYYEMTGGQDDGGIVTPLISGISAGSYDGLEFYIYGGCPDISKFDVIDTIGTGMELLAYPEYNGDQYFAGVGNIRTNSRGLCVGAAVFGFSFMEIRNAVIGTMARTEFYRNTMRSFLVAGHGPPPDYTDSEIPRVTSLSGIYPNPFNPVTRVSFSLKKKGRISMRVYDVSGRLVRVLVDEVREAGSYEVVWDGANDRGRKTASGIYFCRMEADEYQRTVKMVQLR